MTSRQRFESILNDLQSQRAVEQGKMMSSDGIKYKNKVFAFIHRDNMIFKLGKNFKPETIGIQTYTPLAPFKNKAPLKDWFVVSNRFQDQWKELAEEALVFIKKQIDR